MHRELWSENRMGVIHDALHLQNVLISVSDLIFLGMCLSTNLNFKRS